MLIGAKGFLQAPLFLLRNGLWWTLLVPVLLRATLDGVNAGCFFTDVVARTVNANAPDGVSHFISQQFPTGVPATPYKVYHCTNGILCNDRFGPDRLEFYTRKTYEVMMSLRPANKVVASVSMVGLQTLEPIEETDYYHACWFRYGRLNCNR